jgi:regulator of sirC expression with transglutaminase-like and TPR domain
MSDVLYSKQFPFISLLANVPVAFVTYLEKTFWPHDMAIFYPFSDQIPLWQVLGTSLIIILISAAVIIMVKRLPYLFTGWMWFSIAIAPVIVILQVSQTTPYAMADRYHYLPSIGLAVMMAWGIPLLFKSDDLRKKILFPMAIAFLTIISILTWQQCRYWKNSITLFSHTLRVTKDNAMAHNNLGLTLYIDGRIEDAIDHYNESIRTTPDFADAYNNRGGAYAKLGRPRLAIQDFNKAIELKHNYATAYFNRGSLYAVLGQYQLAIDNLSAAIRLKPDYAGAYNNRAFVYINQGDYISGCRDAKRACEMGDCKVRESSAGRELCR